MPDPAAQKQKVSPQYWTASIGGTYSSGRPGGSAGDGAAVDGGGFDEGAAGAVDVGYRFGTVGAGGEVALTGAAGVGGAGIRQGGHVIPAGGGIGALQRNGHGNCYDAVGSGAAGEDIGPGTGGV